MKSHQIERMLELVDGVIGDDVVGAYLFGSAVLGGLKPNSDLDVMVVSKRATTRDEKLALVSGLLEISRKPRHIELTIVVESDVVPWRYPPRMDLQYGDWWREEFERGDVEPWGSPENPDLTSLIRMVLLADTALVGPPPAQVFEPVPRGDYVAALLASAREVPLDLDTDTRNVVLTLVRIWSSLATDEIRSKKAAADWALVRLPSEHRAVLAEARALYVGDRDGWSGDPVPAARALAGYVLAEIERAEWSETLG